MQIHRVVVLGSAVMLSACGLVKINGGNTPVNAAGEGAADATSTSKPDGGVTDGAQNDKDEAHVQPAAGASPFEALRKASVVVTQPTLTSDDSYDLEKVAQAFASIDKGALVAVKGKDMVQWTPSPHDKLVPSDRLVSQNCKNEGLEAFGLSYLRESSGFGAVRIEFDICRADYDHVPEGTPGVVWEVLKENGNDKAIVFVTLDGGRYVTWQPDALTFQMPPSSSWPTAPAHQPLGPRELTKMKDKKSVEATAKFEETKKAWDKCLSPILDKEEAEYKANNQSLTGNNAKTAAKFEAIRENTCGKHKKKYEATMLAFLQDRAKVRAALFDENKKRFGN